MKSAAYISPKQISRIKAQDGTATRDVATECVNSLPALFGLFVVCTIMFARGLLIVTSSPHKLRLCFAIAAHHGH